ncbi:reverse transcriptase domain-containing protein, partial [Tanacetum coccineum]
MSSESCPKQAIFEMIKKEPHASSVISQDSLLDEDSERTINTSVKLLLFRFLSKGLPAKKFDGRRFYEAWDRFKIFLGDARIMGFQIASIDTFYNALTQRIKIHWNSLAGVILRQNASRMLKIIESKSKLLLPVLKLSFGNTVTNPKRFKGITPEVVLPSRTKAVNHDAEPNVAPVVTPDVAPIPKASIPFPSRRNDERRKEKANDQIEKFYEIFRDLSFEISFTDALMLMPKFASTLKTLIGNKEKLSELARTPLNENCSAVILNKLPKKLGDPGRFLIPCEFTGITTCNALADLGASINLMPYSVWKDLALPELTPTCMTDFLLMEEADSFLALEDDPTSSEVDPTYQDPEGDIDM